MNGVLAGLLAAAVFTGLYAAGLKIGTTLIDRTTPRRPNELRYPSVFGASGLVFGAVAGLLFGIGLVGGIHPGHVNFGPWLLVMASFGGTGLALVIATANWRFWIDADGVQVRDGLGRVGAKALWSEIASVEMGWRSYVFVTRDGRRLKAPMGARGTLELLQIAAGKGPRIDARLQALIAAISGK